MAKEEIDRLGFTDWERIKDYYQGPAKGHYIHSEATELLTEEEMKDITFLAEEFRYLHFYYGSSHKNSERKLSREELNSLVPYLTLFGEQTVIELAKRCQQLGFFDWIKNHLYPLMDENNKPKFFPLDSDILHELQEFANRKQNIDLISYFERLPFRSVDDNRFFDCLVKFAESRNDLDSLRIICDILLQIGTRKQIPIIENYLIANMEDEKAASSIKEDTIFLILSSNFAEL